MGQTQSRVDRNDTDIQVVMAQRTELQEERSLVFSLGKPKPKVWNYRGVNFYVGSDLSEFSGARKGQIQQMGVRRYIFDARARSAMKASGRTPPKNFTYLMMERDWQISSGRINPWSWFLLAMLIGFILIVGLLEMEMETCKDSTQLRNSLKNFKIPKNVVENPGTRTSHSSLGGSNDPQRREQKPSKWNYRGTEYYVGSDLFKLNVQCR